MSGPRGSQGVPGARESRRRGETEEMARQLTLTGRSVRVSHVEGPDGPSGTMLRRSEDCINEKRRRECAPRA